MFFRIDLPEVSVKNCQFLNCDRGMALLRKIH
ncbi:hypothetical protein RUA4292_02885 [Ruegeria atlantica]|uniref:Uncharacterized protein n=1 Tax=Ruegeria atlantica TaxID=81569 RepID=A0A0N7LQQ8_9RHOB|nr:hypothetical protein RUM4293_03366 [Ruegeria atlantica]CUH48700.1 hypothetical protein RUA4292_02885 [Ruegeria atlantica]